MSLFVLHKGVHAADLQCLFVLHCIPGNQRAREPSHGTALTASIKPQLNGSRPPQTPIRPSPMGSRSTPASRPLRKTLGPSRGLTEACVNTEQSKGAGRPQGEPKNLGYF